MRQNKKKEGSKNLHLGFYFGLLVLFIIIVSVVFKIFDTIQKSKFDGDNFFTVAVISGKDSNVISVSPKDGSLKKIKIGGISREEDLRDLGIPYDSIAKSENEVSASPKSYFSKILFHKDGLSSNLTIIDLVRLAFYSQKTDGAKVQEESVSGNNSAGLDLISSQWFIDPAIEEEKVNIEITNTTSTSGLGNKFAREITNMGGNVVLVNSSQEPVSDSKIYYKEDSYTVRKLSKLLEIEAEKKETNSISDIIIEIGKDKENY